MKNRGQDCVEINTKGMCAKYVKIALWKAGYSPNNGDFAPGVSPARLLGPWLEKAGFNNITNELPDGRWAAPGDVIVYKKIDDPSGAGHVDIRTYDGYVSDFFETYLPVTQFEVIGIYRKFYDPLPEIRMRAFLRVIRSREAKSVLAAYGDTETYRTLPEIGHKIKLFDNFSTHPFSDNPNSSNSASGAYGTLLATWKRYVVGTEKLRPWTPVADGEQKFSPKIQDRISVAAMELHLGVGYASNKGITELGLVRMGKIEEAAKLLATKLPYQWPSLPGGSQSDPKYGVSQMLQDYDKYFSAMRKEINQ